ncbi:MAG: hypothetical protein A3F96_02385 [Parcubacteria group bacterium RIFCSPLOWO2_12_FULL_40_10]|nr:MAG: hypothetical protein A3F96_02385 [Parcubacteria group bacterium RIFCSPLOWO2_12_FULL_40_10]
MVKKHKGKKFYGTTTLGERGQVVIPLEARKAMKIDKSEKLLVFGIGRDILIFSKASNLRKMVSHLSAKLKIVKDIIKKSR